MRDVVAIQPDVPWEQDHHCRFVVRRNPSGLTYAQIGEALGGLSRERVRQIEARALSKLRKLARRDQAAGELLLSVLGRDEPVSPWEEMHSRG